MTVPYITEALIRRAAIVYKVASAELLGPKRDDHLARIRFAIIKVAREEGELSFPRLGRDMSRDPTSVWHGYNRANELYAEDAEFALMVDKLRASLPSAAAA